MLKHVEALFLIHARSLWVTGSSVGHGELCGSWGALSIMGSPAGHGEPCGLRGALQHMGSSPAHGRLGPWARSVVSMGLQVVLIPCSQQRSGGMTLL